MLRDSVARGIPYQIQANKHGEYSHFSGEKFQEYKSVDEMNESFKAPEGMVFILPVMTLCTLF